MSSQARVLERPDRVPARNGSKTAKKPAAYCDQPSATSVASDPQDWAARQVREWLLLILRFAVTTDPKDLSATLALADEIDARGLEWRPSAPSFFRRTSNDVCRAITALDDPKRAAIDRDRGSLAALPLPHHRAYGSVHGGSRSCANTLGTGRADRGI